MNKDVTKTLLILNSILLVVMIAAGTTLSYLVSRTNMISNTFEPAEVSTSVLNNNNLGFYSFRNNNGRYSIMNTGNTNIYVRATILVNWKDANGNIYGIPPTANVDYTVYVGDEWNQHSDGFYYYTLSLSPQTETSVALMVEPSDLAIAPEGYEMSVEIIASGIQATHEAVIDAWGIDPTTLGQFGNNQ